MFDRDFFTSKLGIAALVSIAAMIAFNVLALNQQVSLATAANPSQIAMVELA